MSDRHSGRVYIIGFTGVGKTTLGRRFAKLNGYGWIDTDDEIEKALNNKLSYVAQIDEGARLRREETKILKKSLTKTDTVISTGSGIVLAVENRKILRTNLTILLKDSAKNIYDRGYDKNSDVPIKESQDYAYFEKEYSRLSLVYDQCSKYTFDLEAHSEKEIFNRINDAILLEHRLYSFISKIELEEQEEKYDQWQSNRN